MTGISCQLDSFCNAATTAKPSIFRHHQIEQDYVRLVLLYTIQRFATVLCLSYGPLRSLKPSAQPFALDRVVLHHTRGSVVLAPEIGRSCDVAARGRSAL